MASRADHRACGYLRRLPTKRDQVLYPDPDSVRHKGPETFAAKCDARAWLGGEQRRIATEVWVARGLRSAVAELVVPLTSEYAGS